MIRNVYIYIINIRTTNWGCSVAILNLALSCSTWASLLCWVCPVGWVRLFVVDVHIEVPPGLESRKGIVNQPPNTTSKHPTYNQPLTDLHQCPHHPYPLFRPFLKPQIKIYIYQSTHVHPSSWVTLTGKRLNSRKKKLCAKPEKISLPSCRGWAVFQSLNGNHGV